MIAYKYWKQTTFFSFLHATPQHLYTGRTLFCGLYCILLIFCLYMFASNAQTCFPSHFDGFISFCGLLLATLNLRENQFKHALLFFQVLFIEFIHSDWVVTTYNVIITFFVNLQIGAIITNSMLNWKSTIVFYYCI